MQDALASTPRFDSQIPTPQQDDRLGAPPEGPRWEPRAEENTRRPLADITSVKENKSQNQEESDKKGNFTVPVTGRGRIGSRRITGPKWQKPEAADEG